MNFQEKYTISFPVYLNKSYIETPLGHMMAIADESGLYLLEFVDSCNIERKIARLERITHSVIIPSTTNVHTMIEKELKAYFTGTLQKFSTPVLLLGTQFQNSVWLALKKIPKGSTCSYGQLAEIIGYKSAVRAVANAQSKNQLAIIIPCHRIIKSNGDLCGYAGGLDRKKWLVEHETKIT